MRVLVTGGAGFIGSHVAERLLRDGHEVIIVDNFDPFYPATTKRGNLQAVRQHGSVAVHEVDIRERERLREHVSGPFDQIIHLAAKAGVRPSLLNPFAYQAVNVAGLQNVLELAREWQVKQFVFASSSSVYGINPNTPWREADNVLLPISPYASTKVSGELLGHVYAHLYGIRFLALRFFTVYGPRQRPDLAIHKFARAMWHGEPVSIFGNGATRRDYTYIDDIVSGIVSALAYTRSMYEVINLGTNHRVSVNEMIDELESVLDVRAERVYGPEQPGDVPETYADVTKAQLLLGYNPVESFKSGLRKFADWFLAQSDMEAGGHHRTHRGGKLERER